MWIFPGTTAPQSHNNLQNWIDAIAVKYSPGCRARNRNGGFPIGHYQEMKGVETDHFLGDSYQLYIRMAPHQLASLSSFSFSCDILGVPI